MHKVHKRKLLNHLGGVKNGITMKVTFHFCLDIQLMVVKANK